MKSFAILFFTTILITIFYFNNASAQNKIQRTATISYKDSVVKTSLFRKQTSFPAKSSLVYFWFAQNSVHATQGGYSGKLLHGSYNSFYTNNNLCQSGKFCKGLKSGKWLNWYPDGHLKEESQWRGGRRDGVTISYNEMGNIKEVKQFRRDELIIKKEKQKKEKGNTDVRKNRKADGKKDTLQKKKIKFPSLRFKKKPGEKPEKK